MTRGSVMANTQSDDGIVTHPFRKERRIMVIRSEIRVSKSLPKWVAILKHITTVAGASPTPKVKTR